MKKNIAVIDGGYSHEAQISFKSADTVMNNLDSSIYNVYRIRITEKEWKLVDNSISEEVHVDKNDFSIQVSGSKITFDCAMIIIHGTPGEDGKLQAYFDMIGIKYASSSQLMSTLTFSKYYCNKLLATYGINCAKAVLLRKPTDHSIEEIAQVTSMPCFVKPNDGGSSFGAARVNKIEDLAAAITHAFEHGNEVIVEEFLPGTEVTNGIIKHRGSIQALAVTEIVTNNEFFDFEAKYNGESQEITPARISDELTLEIQTVSEDIYRKMGLNGVARIDYMIKNGTPYVIEINTIPGQSAASLIPQQAKYAGIELKDLYGGLIEDALSES